MFVPGLRFLVIGKEEPSYKARMLQLARELGLEQNVSWLGPIANPLTVVPRFDVAVLSSQSEAMSNAILEYMSAGIPTVATDVGGTREILQDGQNGLLVPPQNPQALAEPICRLLADPALRKALGEHARRRAETEFCEKQIVQEYVQLYAGLCGADPVVDPCAALSPVR